ncbi:CDP-glycerol glycerophosphotransferase family protein [Isoptericola sp. 4D.3]|uniref:CDP-glycerol glycerophosphotransferase family protein n=1 Tax=Isoptericola peretonis TaxID=2918523 RepID=A0ABT0J6D5_9MICO|nr:CDP-glycerol glycerophosphotransferase family protein [Isoptericola sp. 4D.3]
MRQQLNRIARRVLPNRLTAPPTLVGFEGGVTDARLTISAHAGDRDGARELVLVGRTSGLEARVPLEAAPEGWTGEVVDADLTLFEGETVDLFLAPLGEGVEGRRRRVASGIDLTSFAVHEAPRRWYTTVEGNVSLRRRKAAEVIAESGAFDVDHYLRQVERAGVEPLPADMDPVEHYVGKGVALGLDPSPMFDTRYYQRMNPAVRRNPLAHYCEYGWRELRDPAPDFDTWWYWSKHLDPGDDGVNPLTHYRTTGRRDGLSTRPEPSPSRRLGPGHRFAPGQDVRRVCLFAGYDPDGVVDDYVVAYVRELARHADVYYMADGEMPSSELAKLAEHTKGAWAERHGRYDFGSYSRLTERVGWSTLEQYDELLLVNDSGYLLRPLDDVFARMDGRACDWWGLQATKGIYRTRNVPVNQFHEPIPMDAVRGPLLDRFEQDYTYDFLVGSYFLAYRRPVVQDPEFRRYLASVSHQDKKRNVVLKYEVGLTRWLVHHGHPFDTYVSHLYPLHPVYTRWYFRLLDEGFPLFKRYFLTSNHYEVPGLADWADRVLEKVPDADVAMFERNLARVADPDTLRRNLSLGSEAGVVDAPVPDELLTPAEFAEADRLSPKHGDWWAFPVCGFTHDFSGNERAVFEEVKDDPSIRKIVLTRDKEVRVDGVNVEVVPLDSPEGQHRLMRAGTIFIKHSRYRNVGHPVSSSLHNLIQVWHGIPFKRIGYASADYLGRLDRTDAEQSQYRAVIASSKVDALAMTAAFYPLTFHQVWNTGLPRNDFVLRDEDRLPAHLRDQLGRLRALVGERRLLLFVPTFRNAADGGAYRFSPEELARLGAWLERNGYVLGVREHMAAADRGYGAQFSGLPTLDLSTDAFPDVEMLYRVSSALVTDYSSAFIDYLLTGKPAVSFAYDYEAYQLERGGFYDLDLVFPGPICETFDELLDALDGLSSRTVDEAYEFRRRLFFDHLDDRASARVVARVRDLTTAHGVGKSPVERVA